MEELRRRVEKLECDMIDVKRDMAVHIEGANIYRSILEEVKEGLADVREMLLDHITRENADRVKLLALIIVTAVGSLGAFAGVLFALWDRIFK